MSGSSLLMFSFLLAVGTLVLASRTVVGQVVFEILAQNVD